MRREKINIVHIITALEYGGASETLFLLLKSLPKDQYAINVFTIVRAGRMGDRIKRDLGIPVTNFGKRTKIGLWTMMRIFWMLKKIKPDIVHTHLFGGDTWGRIPAIIANVPIIVSTEHHTNYEEYCLKRWIKKFLSFWTDEIICVSQSVMNFSLTVDHMSQKKIRMIYTAIDHERYHEIPIKKACERTIGMIGRLDSHKGHEIFFHSLVLLLPKFPDLRTLIIYSSGEQEERLKNLVRTLKLWDFVQWVKGAQDMVPFYQQLDILIFPSYYEGLGLVGIEAMSAGRVVVGTKVEGISEIVRHNETGLLVKSGNAAELASAITILFHNPDLYEKLAKNGRNFVLSTFSVQKFSQGYQSVYQKWLKKKL